MVADPGLGWAVRAATVSVSPEQRQGFHRAPHVTWQTLRPLLNDFWALVATRVERKHRAGRLKQWLNFLRRRYPEAETAYVALRTLNDPALIDAWLHDDGAKHPVEINELETALA